MSTGSNEADVELEECEALLATDADCARSAVSSLVSRLTCHGQIVVTILIPIHNIRLLLALSRILSIAQLLSRVEDVEVEQ